MLEYTLSAKTRAKMAKEHRAVQTAISSIANQSFRNPGPPDGIGKYEGGVRVNGREICIRKNNVMDDWTRAITSVTPEERAVVNAIGIVAAQVEQEGIQSIRPYGFCRSGDPLRAMFAGHDMEYSKLWIFYIRAKSLFNP